MKFQFQFGTIGRLCPLGVHLEFTGFQFQFGTIGSLKLLLHENGIFRFQFQFGTIGSPYCNRVDLQYYRFNSSLVRLAA